MNLLQNPLKLLPLPHQNLTPRLPQHLLHLLLLAHLITPHITHRQNPRPNRRRRTTLTILNRHTLLRLHPQLLHRVQIHRRIRFARRLLQRRRRAVNAISKILRLVCLLHARLQSSQRTRAHNRHQIPPFLFQPHQLLVYSLARLQRRLELRNHLVFFFAHVPLEFRSAHLVVVFALETADHAAEILSHEFREELGTRVPIADAAGFENLIGEIGTCFEGEGFGEHECVVAVEEESGYLGGWVGC